MPLDIDNFATCLQNKMRKAARGSETNQKATRIGERLAIDFGFMFQQSKDTKCTKMLQGHDGSTAYLLIFNSYSDLLFGIPTSGKSPPLLWLHTLLTRICPSPDVHKVVRMDLGGETGRHPALRTLFLHHGYAIETTYSDASSQNGSVEHPHSTIGHAL